VLSADQHSRALMKSEPETWHAGIGSFTALRLTGEQGNVHVIRTAEENDRTVRLDKKGRMGRKYPQGVYFDLQYTLWGYIMTESAVLRNYCELKEKEYV
jgi:hypothetical protein